MDCKAEVKDLIDRLLVADPVKRLRSLSALKRTSFFMRFDFENVLKKVVDLDRLEIREKKSGEITST